MKYTRELFAVIAWLLLGFSVVVGADRLDAWLGWPASSDLPPSYIYLVYWVIASPLIGVMLYYGVSILNVTIVVLTFFCAPLVVWFIPGSGCVGLLTFIMVGCAVIMNCGERSIARRAAMNSVMSRREESGKS